MLIVLTECELPFRDRIDRFADDFADIGAPVNVLPVTVFELEERREEPFWAKFLAKREALA